MYKIRASFSRKLALVFCPRTQKKPLVSEPMACINKDGRITDYSWSNRGSPIEVSTERVFVDKISDIAN